MPDQQVIEDDAHQEHLHIQGLLEIFVGMLVQIEETDGPVDGHKEGHDQTHTRLGIVITLFLNIQSAIFSQQRYQQVQNAHHTNQQGQCQADIDEFLVKSDFIQQQYRHHDQGKQVESCCHQDPEGELPLLMVFDQQTAGIDDDETSQYLTIDIHSIADKIHAEHQEHRQTVVVTLPSDRFSCKTKNHEHQD